MLVHTDAHVLSIEYAYNGKREAVMAEKKNKDIRYFIPDRILARDYIYNYLQNYIGKIKTCNDSEMETMRCLFTAICLVGNAGADSNACTEVLDTMFQLLKPWDIDYIPFCEYMTKFIKS